MMLHNPRPMWMLFIWSTLSKYSPPTPPFLEPKNDYDLLLTCYKSSQEQHIKYYRIFSITNHIFTDIVWGIFSP